MFGLFGKSEFNTEMAALDKQSKKLGSDSITAMKAFEINKQVIILKALIENCELKVQCCKKYGKLDEMRKWDVIKQKFLQLHG